MDDVTARRSRVVLWAVAGIPVAAVSLGWCFLGLLGFLLKCDEACGGESADPSSWQWIGQFVLAVIGVGAAGVAVVLGVRDRHPRSLQVGAFAVVCAVVWWEWVQTIGL